MHRICASRGILSHEKTKKARRLTPPRFAAYEGKESDFEAYAGHRRHRELKAAGKAGKQKGKKLEITIATILRFDFLHRHIQDKARDPYLCRKPCKHSAWNNLRLRITV